MSKGKYFVHESSFVDEKVSIGNGTKIWHFSHVMTGSRIGKDCTVGQNVFIGKNVTVGEKVRIQNNVSVFEGVEIDDHVFCGPSVTFTNVKKPRSQFPVDKRYAKTKVGQGATIGANATIICPRNVGKYAFIGAGSVVTLDVPDYVMAYGNPARPQGYVCQCGEKLNFSGSKKTSCAECKRRYRKDDGRVKLITQKVV